MGGNLPLGYDRHPDPNTRTLVVNPAEAQIVQRLFHLYVDLGCLRSKRRTGPNGAISLLRTSRPTSCFANCPASMQGMLPSRAGQTDRMRTRMSTVARTTWDRPGFGDRGRQPRFPCFS